MWSHGDVCVLVAAVASVATIIPNIMALRLTMRLMQFSKDAQAQVDAILDEDRRYKAFLDTFMERMLKDKTKQPFADRLNLTEKQCTENARFIARAVREGDWEASHGYARQYILLRKAY